MTAHSKPPGVSPASLLAAVGLPRPRSIRWAAIPDGVPGADTALRSFDRAYRRAG